MRHQSLEPRGALGVPVDLGGGVELQVFNTHFGLVARERSAEDAAPPGAEWLGHPDRRGKPAVLLSHFNAVSRSSAYGLLASGCAMPGARCRGPRRARASPRAVR
ncbi:MAG: hypothetical protein ICV73_12645 [Acetobacteraceae bacterium]|nr:hypothetical protein [Acetobacteraceae bacterium]